MSYIMLNEKLSKADILLTIIAFVGVIIMSEGFNEEQEENKNFYTPIIAIIGLVSLPINDSYGNILQRKLRSLHYMTLFLYLNSLFLVMLAF